MILTRCLGIQPYQTTWLAMQTFTDNRDKHTRDELWLCQHPDVFTQGLAGKSKHLLKNPDDIPVIWSDRGGQITFHNLGQAVIYCLIDLKRLKMGIKQAVHTIENSVIQLLRQYGIDGIRRPNAPGVYVNNAKISALGLRVRHGCTYHGLSLNINNNLTPFTYINPCGYANLAVTNMAQLSKQTLDIAHIGNALCHHLTREFYAARN